MGLSFNESDNELNGFTKHGYAFHTNNELNPFWSCDLLNIYPIHSIQVFYRKNYYID